MKNIIRRGVTLSVGAFLVVSVGSGSAVGEPQLNSTATSDSVAQEPDFLANQALVTEENSPGLYYPDSSSKPVIRVYADTSAHQAVSGIDAADATLAGSRYGHAELAALEAALPSVVIPDGQWLAASYDAESDLFLVSGSIDATSVDQALAGFTYRYQRSSAAGGGRL